jgi:hypothetical protein
MRILFVYLEDISGPLISDLRGKGLSYMLTTFNQKATRVAFAIELMKGLTSSKYWSWCCFMTGDGSSFPFSTDNDYLWVPKGASTPTRPRQTIISPKRMLTICWSSLGFAVVKILPKAALFDATYFCAAILSEID